MSCEYLQLSPRVQLPRLKSPHISGVSSQGAALVDGGGGAGGRSRPGSELVNDEGGGSAGGLGLRGEALPAGAFGAAFGVCPCGGADFAVAPLNSLALSG